MNSAKILFGEDAEVLRDTDFQLLVLTNTIGPLGTIVLSPILGSLIVLFDASASNIGLMISAFTAPSIIGIPLAGNLSDRYGRKPVMVFGALVFGVAGVAIFLTTDFAVALGLRFLQGIGFAGLNPIIVTSIGDLYSGAEETTAQGLRFMHSGLVQTLFPVVSGTLAIVGLQYPFLLFGIAIPIGVVIHLRLVEPKERAANRREVERDGAGTESYYRALFRTASDRQVFLVLVARGLPGMIWAGFFTYISLVVARILEGDPQKAGLLLAVGSVSYAVGGSQAGRARSAFGNYLYPLIGAHVCLGIGLALAAFAPTIHVAGISAALVGVGLMSIPLYRSILADIAHREVRGGLISFGEAWSRTNVTLAPLIVGGAIGVFEQEFGIIAAIRWAFLGVGATGSLLGIACLLLAFRGRTHLEVDL